MLVLEISSTRLVKTSRIEMLSENLGHGDPIVAYLINESVVNCTCGQLPDLYGHNL